MTSKQQGRSCFVYMTLPGQTDAVTVGRFDLAQTRAGIPLGKFVYGKKYLARNDAVEIDPVELKLAELRYETLLNDGVFSSLKDASPDHWGRLVIQKALRTTDISETDYLLHSPDDRAGALSFGLNEKPPAPMRQFNKTLQLAQIQKIALAIIRDQKPLSGQEVEQIRKLLLEGSSLMGGARPKAVVEDDDGLWIAKFNRPDDPWDMALVERSMLILAKSCDLSVAECKIAAAGNRNILLVKRFDREKVQGGYLHHRMVSGATMLRTDDKVTDRSKWSYLQLVEELRRASANPRKDAKELFKRMCFNALVSNLDDHPKNHAIIAKNREWRLSPAYDIVPSRSTSLQHRDLAMTVGDFGRYASAQNLLSECRRFLLEPEQAQAIISEMEGRVRTTWLSVARKAKVSIRDCNAIEGAFAYPGFSFALQIG
jgi:serine/threonine-protein kinase HipA